MKALINKSKSKRLITLSIVVVLLFQLILASVVNINFSEDVHAEALSPKDTLLLKVLKAGFKKCIDGGVRKINFYTYAAKFAGDAIRKMAAETNGNLYSHDVFVTARESMKETYRDAIRVFRNNKVSL